MRLDYLVSHSTDLPRKSARALISAGRVAVNGETVRRAGQPLSDHHQVTLDGELLALPSHRYLMLHKPPGVVSASRDARHRTVVDLVPVALRSGLHPAGRLDRDTTGLVLLTSDGGWSHRLTSPASCLYKRYRVTLAEPVASEHVQQLCEGIELRGEARPTRPAQIESVSPTRLVVSISEGRYHQIKRMFGALGNRVVALHREAIGPVALDPALAPGDFRPLSAQELDALSGKTSNEEGR